MCTKQKKNKFKILTGSVAAKCDQISMKAATREGTESKKPLNQVYSADSLEFHPS